MNIQWDAHKYTEAFSFVHQYGTDVLELLDFKRGMTVLDLGCGNGALTEKLSEMGAVATGLDASDDLLQIARKNYPELEFIRADATDFALKQNVDAVFSNAVFHWIDRDKQESLLKCIYLALKEKGQLVFEFGGAGNNQLIHTALQRVFAEHGMEYEQPFYFPSIGQYAPMLEKAGFRVTYMNLFDRITRLNGENGLEDWIKLFIKKPFEGISDKDRSNMIQQAVAMLGNSLYHDGIWYADYVRIRGKAIKV